MVRRLNRPLAFLGAALIVPAASQVNFTTPQFTGALAAGSGVLESLRPASDASFDFSPSYFFAKRNNSGQYHTGDLTLRYRSGNATAWIDADSGQNRTVNTDAVGPSDGPWLSSMNGALANATSLNVTRTWSEIDGDLTLQFDIKNIDTQTVELGSLGMPIEFGTIFSTLTPHEITERCVLVDPYIGLDAGYLQVTRLTGTGPNLVITPLTNATKLEAWRFLNEPGDLNDLSYQVQTFEGNYEYQIFSKAWAEQEWNATTPWNPATSTQLEPGEILSVGLRFSIVDTVDAIESKVAEMGLPVAVGIPGYVLPEDLEGRLYLNTSKAIKAITSSPEGVLTATSIGAFGSWQGYTVTSSANAFGRAVLNISYDDGSVQAIHYWVAHSGPQGLSEAGNFLATKQWYNDTSDPFHRAPSFLSYDHSVNDFVLQEDRSWIAGLSDEGGAGSFVAASMKQSAWPKPEEVALLETFAHETVWGSLQSKGDANWTVYGYEGNTTYGVRKSLFFYEPALVPGYNYSSAYNWQYAQNQSGAYLINRAYDYVHVSVVWWSLYKVGRMVPDILTQATPEWYLLQAYNTAMFAGGVTNGANNTNYYFTGLLGETVWGDILNELRAENFTDEATALEAAMKKRQTYWASIDEPYGSEQAWDCTGQEGVYYWSAHFGDVATVNKTIQSIRGFMPTIPHWAYNGNARRYWDFTTAGEHDIQGIERQIHHYGSGINALPLFQNYRNGSDPQSLEAIYDLRVAYGGHLGSITNLGSDGFGSMAFHGFPDRLFWDPYTGDYGPNLLGHILGAATYLVDHPTFGWISFGGNVGANTSDSSSVTVEPRDGARKRIFVAPISLYVTLDAGGITSFVYDTQRKSVSISVDQGALFGAAPANQTILKFEQAPGAPPVTVTGAEQGPRGYVVALPGNITLST